MRSSPFHALITVAGFLALLVPSAAGEEQAKRIPEAALPAGFAEPAAIDTIVRKTIPAHRAVEGPNFWTCFQHIKKHDIPMTAPVVMPDAAVGAKGRGTMRFLFPDTETGQPGPDGQAEVIDVPEQDVIAISLRGKPGADRLTKLEERLRAHAAEHAITLADLPPQLLGYNSPMVPRMMQLWELQMVIADTAPAATDTAE